MKRHASLVLAAVLALVVTIPAQQAPESPQRSGADAAATRPPAPEFSLKDLTGRKIDLAGLRGKVVLLNFWATWCAPCRAEIPEFVELQNRYRSRGLQIIGISLDDDAEPVLDFHRNQKFNYPVAVGDAELAERYGGILGLPVSFLIGCDGRIDAKYAGKADPARIEQQLKVMLRAKTCTGGGTAARLPGNIPNRERQKGSERRAASGMRP